MSSELGVLPEAYLKEAGSETVAKIPGIEQAAECRHRGQFGRQSVFGRLGGYDDVNDADRLGRDPAMRWIVGGKAIERQAASTSQMGRFETELLATDENVEALVDMNGVWTGNYVHVIVANRRGQEGIFLGGYKAFPSQATGEGTLVMELDTSHVREKKFPRFFHYRSLPERCGESNC